MNVVNKVVQVLLVATEQSCNDPDALLRFLDPTTKSLNDCSRKFVRLASHPRDKCVLGPTDNELINEALKVRERLGAVADFVDALQQLDERTGHDLERSGDLVFSKHRAQHG